MLLICIASILSASGHAKRILDLGQVREVVPIPHTTDMPPRQRLFSDSLRSLHPLPIYDFLENALAGQGSLSPEQELVLKKVVFTTGSWSTLRQVTPADDCSISDKDGQHYIVSWKRGGHEFVTLHFPIDYELLAGSTRKKMERAFIKGLSSFTPDIQDEQLNVSIDELYHLAGDSIYMLKGDTFRKLPDFTSHTFYTLKNQQPVLLFDLSRPRETLANWLLSLSSKTPDACLTIDMQMTGYSNTVLKIGLKQFMLYCRQQGCTPYYGFKDSANGSKDLSAVLLLHNVSAGYAHMVSLSCEKSQITAAKPELYCRMSLFLPVSQVSSFSAVSPKGKSTPKRYE